MPLLSREGNQAIGVECVVLSHIIPIVADDEAVEVEGALYLDGKVTVAEALQRI